jgi:hypothetical protein
VLIILLRANCIRSLHACIRRSRVKKRRRMKIMMKMRVRRG